MKMGSCLELDSRKVIEQYKEKMRATMTKGMNPLNIQNFLQSKKLP